MDNNIEKTPVEKSNKKAKITVAIIVGALIASGALAAIVLSLNSDDTANPIKTEIATDANGTPTVVQGTTPNGTLIENGTYPDGTVVEFATTASGEYATEADGSYIINYVETATLTSGTENSKNTSSNTNNNANGQNSSSNKNNSSSDKSNNSNNSSSSTTGNNSSSNSSNNSSNSTSSSSTNNSSSSTTNTPGTNGDTNATINGSSYNVGDKIKVSYYLKSSVKFCGIQCDVNYDSEILKLDSSSIDTSNLAGSMSNPDNHNQIRFLSSAATAVNDFTKEKLLFSCEFEVLKSSSSDVTINVVDILDNDILSIPSENYTITSKVEKL